MSADIEVTRRRALTALAATGVLSAGTGVGTDAFFSDAERVENHLVAGSLDLAVAWHAVTESSTTRVRTSDGWPTPRSDATAPICDLEDLKPGDSGRITLALHLAGTPGYLSLVGRERADVEDGRQETAPGRSDGAGPAGETGRTGELDELTTVRVAYFSPADPSRPAGPGTTTTAHTTSLASFVGLGGLGDGVPLDGDEVATVYDLLTTAATPGRYPADRTRFLRIEWAVPTWVDDRVATDAFVWDLGLSGVQGGGA